MSLPPNDDTGVPPVPPVPPQPPSGPAQPDAPQEPQAPQAPQPPSFEFAPPSYEPPSYTPPATEAQEPPASPDAPGYAAPAPGYGAPAAPVYGAPTGEASFPGAPASQGYPGSVPPYATGGYTGAPYGGAPAAPQGPGKGLAIAALVLGIVGILGIAVAFIPFAGFAAILVPIVAIVLGVIALAKKKPGKGLAITGTVLGAVALVACATIAIAMTAFITSVASDPDRFISESCEAAGLTQEECDELTTDPGVADPETAPQGDPVAGGSVEVGELAFGQIAGEEGSWWYVVTLDQADSAAMYEYFFFDVEALDAEGRVLDTDTQSATLLPGKTVLVGEFYDLGADPIAELNLVGLDDEMNEAVALPDDVAGEFTFSEVTGTTDYGLTTVTGTISSSFPVDQEAVYISLVARDADGKPVAVGRATTDRIPADGSAKFEGYITGEVPEGATIEASAQLY